MDSISLLEDLSKLPAVEQTSGLAPDAFAEALRTLDGAHFAIEIADGTENALLGLFSERNVPDQLTEAYQRAFTAVSESDSLYERYTEMLQRGPDSVRGFVATIKGKLAEIVGKDILEDRFPQYSFQIAADPTQAIWDIQGIPTLDGLSDVFVQVKMGGFGYVSEVMDRMAGEGVTFLVGSDMYDAITAANPELADQLIDAGVSNAELNADVSEGLDLLFENFGVDVPDSIGEILPYVGEAVLGIRLLLDIIAVQRDFAKIHFEDRARIHAVKAIALLLRFGVTTVCTTVGGALGTEIPIPVAGTLVGALVGAYGAAQINKQLIPYVREVALGMFGLVEDDLFYFKNKTAIDSLALSFERTVA